MSDWVAVGISAAALVLSLLAYLRDRKAAREAAASAERSARRADEAVAAHERMAAALEAQVPLPSVQWRLGWATGSTLSLTNVGSAEAHDVKLDLSKLTMVRGDREYDLIRPEQAVTFMARADRSQPIVGVSWLESAKGSERQSWTFPLPRTRDGRVW